MCLKSSCPELKIYAAKLTKAGSYVKIDFNERGNFEIRSLIVQRVIALSAKQVVGSYSVFVHRVRECLLPIES
jgi:hypothetical protein